MDQLKIIFQSLNVDGSTFVIFGLVVLLFFILNSLLFSKLQFILELREGKTTRLDAEANSLFQEAEKMASEYNSKIDTAKIEGHNRFIEKRAQLEKRSHDAFKKAENDFLSEFEAKKEEVESEVERFRDLIFQEKSRVSDQLVEKLTSK